MKSLAILNAFAIYNECGQLQHIDIQFYTLYYRLFQQKMEESIESVLELAPPHKYSYMYLSMLIILNDFLSKRNTRT